MSWLRVNGVELYYELHGAVGDPLVLVHGSWVDHSTWDAVLPVLQGSFQVLTYDRRGHGMSERTGTPRTAEVDAEDLAALVEGLGLQPAHVVGNSVGGSVAVHLAEARAELLRSLVVHEPPLSGVLDDRPDPQLDLARDEMEAVSQLVVAGDFRGAAQRFVEAVAMGPGAWGRLSPVVQERLVANAGAWLDEFHDTAATQVDARRLSEFYQPALLTVGSLSPGFFIRITEGLASRLPNPTVRVLDGVGHAPHLTDPPQFVGALVEFLLNRSVPVS